MPSVAVLTDVLIALIVSSRGVAPFEDDWGTSTQDYDYVEVDGVFIIPGLPLPSAPIGIQNINRGKGFRSGGSELQIVLLDPSGMTPLFNKSSISLHYFTWNNTSPNVATQVLTQACRVTCCMSLFCTLPDVSELFPNFVADQVNATLTVEPLGAFGGCKYEGRRRLCYSLIADDEKLGFSGYSAATLLRTSIANNLRFSMSLIYYPDPVVTSVTLLPGKKNRLKFTGLGFNGDNAVMIRGYNFSLAGGLIPCTLTTENFYAVQSARNFSVTVGITTTEPPENSNSYLYCDFDNARLLEVLQRAIGTAKFQSQEDVTVDVSIKNGNWEYNTTIKYPLEHAPQALTANALTHTSGMSPEIIVAIAVPLAFTAIVTAGMCVVLCAIRYGYSPAMSKASERVAKICPGLSKLMKPPVEDSSAISISQEVTEIEQLFMLLPTNLAPILKEFIIEPSKIEAGPELGNGNFGIVKSGSLLFGKSGEDLVDDKKEQVAIKFIQRFSDIDQLKEFFQEAVFMFSFDHPNVLSAYGITSVDGFPAVVLPLMDAGDLRKFVRSASDQISDLLLFDFAAQIANGMKYLAEMNIIHRDLAARNCLLNKQRVVKVADFGLSRKGETKDDVYAMPNYATKNNKRPLPMRWMSPESLRLGTFSEKSDVWSFGVLLWEIATRGARPYPAVDFKDLKRHICVQKQRLPKLDIISECFYDVMMSCWSEHSSGRPKFADLVTQLKDSLNDPISPFWGCYEKKEDFYVREEAIQRNFEECLMALSGEVAVVEMAPHTDEGVLGDNHGSSEDSHEAVTTSASSTITDYTSNYSQIESSALTSLKCSNFISSSNSKTSPISPIRLSDYNVLGQTKTSHYQRLEFSRETNLCDDEEDDDDDDDEDCRCDESPLTCGRSTPTCGDHDSVRIYLAPMMHGNKCAQLIID